MKPAPEVKDLTHDDLLTLRLAVRNHRNEIANDPVAYAKVLKLEEILLNWSVYRG